VVRCGINAAHFVVRAREERAKLTVMKLKDKVAIVTGGASGIGAASARLFASSISTRRACATSPLKSRSRAATRSPSPPT
jgi:hypothetical protein